MNNFELNKAIVESLGFDIAVHIGDEQGVYCNVNGNYQMVDYCNNWNDLMPLVVEHRIDLSFPEELDYFIADKMLFNPKPQHICPVICKNPQRALAECLLKVLTNQLNGE